MHVLDAVTPHHHFSLAPPRHRGFLPVLGRLAHKVAHKPTPGSGKKRRIRPSFKTKPSDILGFRRRSDTSMETERLRRDFLVLLEEENPDAFEEWQGLLPYAVDMIAGDTYDYYNDDGILRRHLPTLTEEEAAAAETRFIAELKQWAERYYLAELWVLDFAAQSLCDVATYPKTGPPRFRLRNTMYYTAGNRAPWTHEVESYDGNVTPAEYLHYARDAFERALDAHLTQRIAEFRVDPDLVPLGRDESRARHALRAAVRWQTTPGAGIDGSDVRTVEAVLERVGLTPREPLKR